MPFMSNIQRPLMIIKTGDTFASIAHAERDFEHWIMARIGEYYGNIIVVDPRKGQALLPIAELAGVIITGSHAMVTDKSVWMNELSAWLQVAVNKELPILGICFGHQLLAQALGGEVKPHPFGAEVGSIRLIKEAAADNDPLFYDLPNDTYVHAVHWQSVRSLPQGAHVLASSMLEARHAFRVGKCAWGVQFHPEFTASIMRGYIEAASDQLLKENQQPLQLLHQVQETPWANALLSRFTQWLKNA